MPYPVDNPGQLRAVLKALRQSRHLSQAAAGRLLGVNQKRIARIESAPGVTSFTQIARLVAAYGGRVVIVDAPAPDLPPIKAKARAKAAPANTAAGNW